MNITKKTIDILENIKDTNSNDTNSNDTWDYSEKERDYLRKMQYYDLIVMGSISGMGCYWISDNGKKVLKEFKESGAMVINDDPRSVVIDVEFEVFARLGEHSRVRKTDIKSLIEKIVTEWTAARVVKYPKKEDRSDQT